MFYEKKVSSFAWEIRIPCCLVWDGVKLELELELELAGLGCSDFKEEEKAIINKFTGHNTSKIKKTTLLLKNSFLCRNSPTLCKKNEHTLHYAKNSGPAGLWYPFCLVHHVFTRCRNKDDETNTWVLQDRRTWL